MISKVPTGRAMEIWSHYTVDAFKKRGTGEEEEQRAGGHGGHEL